MRECCFGEGVLHFCAQREALCVHEAAVGRLVQPADAVVARRERAVVQRQVECCEGVPRERGDVGEARRVRV